MSLDSHVNGLVKLGWLAQGSKSEVKIQIHFLERFLYAKKMSRKTTNVQM